ncbi:response regulator [Sphingopyxis sp. XHP0097]|jgi:DNA-binding response OmpR family regulator|uniref:Response regulator n=1 Tax=Sphingopyxis jiangsuensis TaxID=2871171 RepID=A0ABS7MC30_9SPHN|nr:MULTISPECIES: response regulator [Sphingopyxis]MBL0767761.1 response regulator [Sphingopyxis lutea]MBY4636577.1 response regulator [Sphingopyxis jiangsuensis]
MTDSDTPRILLVDDEPSIREPLGEYLETQGFAVTAAASAAEARSVLRAQGVDLVVSDIMMPGEDGLSLTRHLREAGDVPVILLTARAEDTERIIGLEMGADDYVVKPFNPRELVARIRTVLRRTQANGRALDSGGTSYAFGPWVLREVERVLVDEAGEEVALSSGEYHLLHALLRHPRQVMSRDRLLDLVRGREADIFDRAIDNLVSRLRKKIETDPAHPQLVKTVWGGGYTLACEVKRIGPAA